MSETQMKDREILLLKREIEHLKKEVRKYKYDYLTGLPLRKDFELDLDLHLEDYKRFKKPFILGIVDVNDLHIINRDSGYHMGDATILSVSKCIENTLIHAGIYRIGGDEFAILCRGNSVEDFDIMLNNTDTKSLYTHAAVNCSTETDNKSSIFKEVDNILIQRKKQKKLSKS